MTEDEARARVSALVDGAALDRLERLVALIMEENSSQNLIAPSTVDRIWARHVLDSLQLLALAGDACGPWLDVGTGGGFPGLVLAAVSSLPFTLVEPRRRRSDFLRVAAEMMGLAYVDVRQAKVEAVGDLKAMVITARAVAPIDILFQGAHHCSTWNTQWLLPRGASAATDLHLAGQTWHGRFEMITSITDPASQIVVASGVARR